MNVAFIIKSEKTPSSRIRILDVFSEIQQHGIQSSIEILPDTFLKRQKLFKKLSDYDIVVLQKKLFNALEFYAFKKYSKYFVFDFDDAIYLKDASPSKNSKDYFSSTRERRFLRTIKSSDLVISANKVLNAKVASIAPEVPREIIFSPVDTSKILKKDNVDIKGLPIIGWIGLRKNLDYVEYVADALREIRKKHDFILRVISDAPAKIDGVRCEHIKWTLEAQNCEIRNFDIGIMPLSQDPYSEGKAAYKLIQYLSAGVPSVCSPVGMNADFCYDFKCALPAKKPEYFAGQIIQLIEHKFLRAELSKKGIKIASEKFDIKVISANLANVLKKHYEKAVQKK